MKWRHLGHLHLLSRAKHPLTAMTQEKLYPRDEIADPPGTNVSSLREMVSLKFRVFSYICVVYNRRQRDLLGIVGSSGVRTRSRGRQCERRCVSYLRRSEPKVLELDSITLIHRIAKGVVKNFRWRRGRFFCGALRTAVAVFAHRMCTDWCKILSQPLKCISLTPHEAPKLAKLQTKSYVGDRRKLPLESAHETALRRRNLVFNWYLKACAAQQ